MIFYLKNSKFGGKTMKKTFNLTDLTKEVTGNQDVNSSTFIADRAKIRRFIKKMQEHLGGPSDETFEAPIEQLEAYSFLIRELLFKHENDSIFGFLKNEIWKKEKLVDLEDSENLKNLVTLFAKAKSKMINSKEKELYDKWLEDQLSDEFYLNSQKAINEILDLIKEDFSNFDNLSSMNAKLNFLAQYINDIRNISKLYRKQVEEILLFEKCFIEVVSSHKELNDKNFYTIEDFLSLPVDIQEEIYDKMEKSKEM
jgi:hypothetical protein